MTKRILVFGIVLTAALLVACGGGAGAQGPEGPEGPPGPPGPQGEAGTMAELTCSECHNDTTLITGKETAWGESVHGTGEAFVRGETASCAGCHSGGAFAMRAAEGMGPEDLEAGDPNPTRQDCRACHNIHMTYTSEDWGLTTTDPVDLYAYEGVTYDGGKGNLCVNCHQPRRGLVVEGGMVNVDSTHWGPHHGPQSALLLGVGGALDVEGSPSAHANVVEDTCVTCHLGPDDSHVFEPVLAACQECHADVEDYDVNGVQTEVAALGEELKAALIAKGMWDAEADHPVVGEYPEAEGAALWNYIYVVIEDKSMGVHNSDYAIALLQASIDALQ